MIRRKIILDVDTGHDDAVAIMMAAREPSIDLVGITVTAGNQTLDKTLRNTLNVCEALQIEAPVYAGMTRPLLRDLETAPLIHGESGFDGPVFAEHSRKASAGHAVTFIVETVMALPPGTVTLVAVGPLTNIAMAIRLEPELSRRLAGIVLMGGSIAAGNVTPSAEFNIHADPEAASVVFSSGAKLTMIGLDVTTKVLLTDDRLSSLRTLPGRAAGIFAASMDHYAAACRTYIGESPAMHDPCCVAYVVNPSMFSVRSLRVDIERTGEFTSGRTVVDLSGVSGRSPNVEVAISVDEDQFWAMLEAALRRYQDPA